MASVEVAMVTFRAVRLCAYLILGAIVLVIFIPCVGNDFMNWDDLAFVVENPQISTLSLKSFVWMFTTFYQGVWHPLTWFSHAMDVALWGADPAYHHLVSVFIHVITVLLVAALFVKLQEARGLPPERVYIAAFTGALLFGVHPLRVESVAWVAERKDVLCAMFYVASLVFFLDYVRATERAQWLKYYVLSLLCLLFALLSKPMAMTLPLVLLVFDFFPLERLTVGSMGRVLADKTPFILLAAGAATLNMAAAGTSGVPLSYVPLYMRTMNAFHSVVFYIKQSVFPQNLIPLYQMDRDLDYLGPRFVIPMLLVLGTTGACIWRAMRSDRLWAAVWFSYLIGLSPVLGFHMSFRHAAADRYTYLPTLGLWLLVGLATARIWEFLGSIHRGALAAKAGLIACVVAVTVAFGVHTHGQIGLWKSTEILWRHVIDHADYIPALAFWAVGREIEGKGDMDEALKYYQTALALDPPNPQYASEVANVIAKKGDRETALAMFKEIAEREPSNGDHEVNIARMYVLMERYDEAVQHLEKSIQLDPQSRRGLLLLAFTHVNRGEPDRGLPYYNRYLSVGYPRRAELDREFGLDADGKKGAGGSPR